MTRQMDDDALVLLERLMGWKASEALGDRIRDPELLAALRELEEWHSVLNEEVEPRPGFTDEVMDAIGAAGRQKPRESMLALTVHGALAALGCFVGLLVVFGGGFFVGPAWLLPGALSVAFGVGGARSASVARLPGRSGEGE